MGQGQGQGQDQGQDHLLPPRAALPPFLVLALTLTLVLALVRNIIIFSKVRVLVLNQPIIVVVVAVIKNGDKPKKNILAATGISRSLVP